MLVATSHVAELVTNSEAVRLFGWYFPGCADIERLAHCCELLDPGELHSLDAAHRDQTWMREYLLGLLTPAASSAWRRSDDGSPGRQPIMDFALALIGRTTLHRWALLWPEYEAFVAPADGLASLDWLRGDPLSVLAPKPAARLKTARADITDRAGGWLALRARLGFAGVQRLVGWQRPGFPVDATVMGTEQNRPERDRAKPAQGR
jgi:hypothetical protein